ncbi:hypothetical protein [Kingella oralis]|uniref:hypothetical protein n=1 Tax=Kingella oralis TaxID=505 RepID=UPI0034E41C39
MEWRRFVADYEQDAPLVYKFCQGFRLPNGLRDGQRAERSGVAPLKQLIRHGRGSLKTVKRDFRLPCVSFIRPA